ARRLGSPLFPYTTLFRSSQVQQFACNGSVRRSFEDQWRGVHVLGHAIGDHADTGREVGDVEIEIATEIGALGRNQGRESIAAREDRKSTRLNSSHVSISY